MNGDLSNIESTLQTKRSQKQILEFVDDQMCKASTADEWKLVITRTINQLKLDINELSNIIKSL